MHSLSPLAAIILRNARFATEAVSAAPAGTRPLDIAGAVAELELDNLIKSTISVSRGELMLEATDEGIRAIDAMLADEAVAS